MELPLRFPPLGVSSDFVNPRFLGLPVIITAGICLPLIVLFAAIRIYARAVVSRPWKFDDYVYYFSCTLGVAVVASLIPNVLANGHHAWDINKYTVSKSSAVSFLAFWIALGPMLWLLKLTLFSYTMTAFGHVRWFKNCAWAGIVVTGLIFSAYTIVVTMTCGPRPGSDAQSYLRGFNRDECAAEGGINATVSNIASVANGVTNFYILLICSPLIPSLPLGKKQMRGVYLMLLVGIIACIFSVVGAVYRIKSWESLDIIGSRIPFYTTFIIETAISLIIPCMPCVWTLYRLYTVPDIDDTTTLATTPKMKLMSNISTPQTESRATWRKTHDIEELPYRKTSSEYSAPIRNAESRMKKLPTTPLPLAQAAIYPEPKTPKTPSSRSSFPEPKTPKTPSSMRSMSLPFMFHDRGTPSHFVYP